MHIHVVVYQVLFTHWVKFKPKSYAAQICSISPTQDNLGRIFLIFMPRREPRNANKAFFLDIANALDDF